MQIQGGIGKAVCHAHMADKAMKWCILEVLTGPAMHPSHKTASKIYTIL